ncbi:MAG: dTMP kinase [Chloroflexota bacterium]|nr:dTMP kinase [Chloroflexota bacterium]
MARPEQERAPAADKRGLFIALEGGEGSGKSSQAQALKTLLEAKGYSVTVTREPGGCELGERVRKLLSESSLALDPHSELFLFAAARAQHVGELILPALERGEIVICDRFSDSSLAYQGHGRGLSLNHVRVVNHIATRGLVPALTVLLNLPVGMGLARKEREASPDRIGQEGREFHERVHRGYLAIAAEEPERFLVVDATLPAAEITQKIWDRAEPLLSAACGLAHA